MNVKKLRVLERVCNVLDDHSILVHGKLLIESQYIIKKSIIKLYNSSKDGLEKWIVIYIDQDYYNRSRIKHKIYKYVWSGDVYEYSKRSYGIIWDNVATKERTIDKSICFYCLDKTNDMTVDHVIPKHIYKSMGINSLMSNTVSSCATCNGLKSSHHPYVFREIAKHNMNKGDNSEYWSRVFKSLNKILINKEGIF